MGEFYNIGSNVNKDNLDVAKTLITIAKRKKLLGKNVKIIFVKDRPGHDMRYAINSNKLKKQLKWKPKVSFMNGLEKTFNWYINNQKYYSNLNKQDILKRLGKKK